MNRSDRGFCAVLGVSTALMLAVSWPLWVEGGLFPRVPFLPGLHPLPPLGAWVRFVALFGTILYGIYDRRGAGVAILLMCWLVAEDQFRLQPWVYQYLLMGLAIAACPPGVGLRLCRWFVVALYFHSGLSKLDEEFLRGPGLEFLGVILRSLRMRPEAFSPEVHRGLIMAMPAWELLVAFGLISLKTRRAAVVGAIVQHAALLIILGPLGLWHSGNVLLWNGALLVEVKLLFWSGSTMELRDAMFWPRSARIVRAIFVLVALLPIGESRGFWDVWPSFSLYSGRNERLGFAVDPEDLGRFPAAIRPYFGVSGGLAWLDLNRWSLAARRVPIYPQARSLLGVAEALASRYDVSRPPRVDLVERRDRATGRRRVETLSGLDAIRRRGSFYLLNAHPVP